MGAQIGGLLSLRGARIVSTHGPALSAERIIVQGNVFLDTGFQAEAATPYGTLRFAGSQIGGQFSLRDATLTNSNGPALHADGIDVKSNMILDGHFTAETVSKEGAVRLDSAQIGNSLSLQGAHISNTAGAALVADQITVNNEVILDGKFRAQVASTDGAIRFPGAKIANMLNLRNAYVVNTEGAVLRADRLTVRGNLLLDDLWADAVSPDGAVRLAGSQIEGQMSLRNARIKNSRGPALHADGLSVEADMFFDGTFHAEAHSHDGVIRIPSARVGGQLSFSGAYLKNDIGVALRAESLTVAGNVYFNARFRAESSSSSGTVLISGASFGGQLTFASAYLTNSEGPALEADGLVVNGSGIFMGDEFRAETASSQGAIRIPGANFDGQLTLRGAHIVNYRGPALVADRLTVKSDVFLGMFYAEGAGPLGVIRLTGASITGNLSLKGVRIVSRHDSMLCVELSEASISGSLTLPIGVLALKNERPGHVSVNGLRYSGTPREASLKEWLTLLRERTAQYFAQPYQQLAAVYRATGHERDVRQILIAQQRDLRQRGEIGGRIRKLMHIMSGATIGYGYRPWRALIFLFLVVSIAVILTLFAKYQNIAAHPKSAGGGPCAVAESLGLAADTAVPLLNTGSKQRCEILATTGIGQWFLAISFVLQGLGWAFATLFVAGYTGIVRKT